MVSPSWGQSTAGTLASPEMSPSGPCSPAEGGEATSSHGPCCPMTQLGHLTAAVPASAIVPACAICQGKGGAARLLWTSPASSRRWHVESPKQEPAACADQLPHPRQAETGRVGRAVPQPQQLLPAVLCVLQTEPWDPDATGFLGSPPHWYPVSLPPVPNVAPRDTQHWRVKTPGA